MIQSLGWISTESAKVLRLSNYGLDVGCWADFIVVNSTTPDEVIRDIRHPFMCFKRGQQTVQRDEATLLRPTWRKEVRKHYKCWQGGALLNFLSGRSFTKDAKVHIFSSENHRPLICQNNSQSFAIDSLCSFQRPVFTCRAWVNICSKELYYASTVTRSTGASVCCWSDNDMLLQWQYIHTRRERIVVTWEGGGMALQEQHNTLFV
jgi:hypothetical protein